MTSAGQRGRTAAAATVVSCTLLCWDPPSASAVREARQQEIVRWMGLEHGSRDRGQRSSVMAVFFVVSKTATTVGERFREPALGTALGWRNPV